MLARGRDRTKGSLSDGKIVTIVTGRISARTGTADAAGVTGSPAIFPRSQHAMLRELAERVRSERLRHNLRWPVRQQVQAGGRQARERQGQSRLADDVDERITKPH
jgi:hypothetical protein